MSCFVGIDTSNYTTSVGIVDEDGNILANIKKLLPVGDGECGLRQSDAVFAHIKNLPEVLSAADPILRGLDLAAVGCSEKPRNVDGSYMPCFLCGKDAALSVVLGRGVPLYGFSHQCGHISAALLSAGAWQIADEPFVAFHVSGGTTEILLCKKGERGFDTEIIGGTLDLNAGQAIDRAGVMMGMHFPCGAEIEREAKTYTGKNARPKISVQDCYCNLSGLQNLSEKMYRESGDRAKTSAFVLDFVGSTLFRLSENVRCAHGALPIVFAGGVMSNGRIRKMLSHLSDVYFAEPMLSADNAVGIAELTRRRAMQLY